MADSSKESRKESEKLGSYLLGEKLGKGAYGVVYKAVNFIEGNQVAVKRLNLKGCSKELVESIRTEISLLKSLDHENIVKYIDEVTTSTDLNIIMEYVEGGSLAMMVKTYGCFPESLVKVYTKKVLVGLEYLHEQGVIHRDIKPDNILITKLGGIKLADFGVSTKLVTTAQDEGSPAGTPYYMAPEVIQFLGARPESDIWSLGCTLIELLKGEPPYFSCDPFSAMYKMVEEEHPPLPPGMSPSLSNFLMQCFKKDVNFRTSAKELSKHAWLKGDKDIAASYSQVTMRLKDFNKIIQDEIGLDPNRDVSAAVTKIEDPKSATLELRSLMKDKIKSKKDKTPRKDRSKHRKAKKPLQEEEDSNNWDDAFASPDTARKIKADDNKNIKKVETIKGKATLTSFLKGMSPGARASLGLWDEFGSLEGIKLGEFSGVPMKESVSSDSTSNDGKLEASTLVAVKKDKKEKKEKKSKDPAKQIVLGHSRTSSSSSTSSNVSEEERFVKKDILTTASVPKGKVDLNQYKEKEGFDMGGITGGTLKLAVKTDLAAKFEDKKTTEWTDDFDALDDALDSRDEGQYLKQIAQDALLVQIRGHLAALKPSLREEDIKATLLKLMDIVHKSPEIKSSLIGNHGLLPIMNLLRAKSTSVVTAALRLLIQLSEENSILINLCVMGIIPRVIQCSNSHNALIRQYAAYFIHRVVSQVESLQMFMGCDALPVLVTFLDPTNYEDNKEMIQIAINCVYTILKVNSQTPLPTNEYYHLFLDAGILERLSTALLHLIADENKNNPNNKFEEEEEEISYIRKVTEVFKSFSNGDAEVKLRMCSKDILGNLNKALKTIPVKHPGLPMLLHMLKTVSADRQVLTQLEILTRNLIEVGIQFVKKDQFIPEIFNPITHTLIHICKLSKNRQEAAVKAGLVPFLFFVIKKNKALREFAVPFMCEIPATSKVNRSVLLENNGLAFFLELLKDVNGLFIPDAIQALTYCLENTEQEKSITEQFLLGKQNILVLKEVFVNVRSADMDKLLESMQKILSLSLRINKSLGADSNFIATLAGKLSHPLPLVRVNLLKTINVMLLKSADPKTFLKTHNLRKAVKKIAKEDTSIMVRQMATTLVKA